jgi:hypothetical protein
MTNYAFSDKVYGPEAIFSSWLNLSYILLTTGLLFYHMVNLKTIRAPRQFTGIISMSLVIISTLYMTYSLGPYTMRMNHVIKECQESNSCYKDQLNHLKFIKNSYLSLGIITSIIQLCIVYLIWRRSFGKK